MTHSTGSNPYRRPNIVLFLTDDHGSWANRCYGNSEVQTPALDALASEGALFENAFTPTGVCSPARACLLTGRTGSQVGIHDWLAEHWQHINDQDWLADEVTLPELLSQSGYACGLSGKWHLGLSHETPRGFDWCFGLPNGQGVHEGTYTYHQDGHLETLTGNKTKIITDRALQFLDGANDQQPFFLNVGYMSTHNPYGAEFHDPEVVSLYENAQFPEIPDYDPHPWVQNEDFPNSKGTSQEGRTRHIGYYSAVTEIDRAVNRIVTWLKDHDQLDNTLVIYTSDHGCSLGQNGFWGKCNSTRPINMYDVSLRVPLIMRWPQIVPPGLRVNECVSHYDTFQTICALTGIVPDPVRQYPGRSYEALLSGRKYADWDSTIYGEYGDLRMARTPEWKLILRYGHRPNQLFNLTADPLETNNLADRPETAAIQAELTAKIDQFYATHDDPAKTGLRATQYPPQSSASPFHDGLRERNVPS